MFNGLPQGLTWKECGKRLWKQTWRDDVFARAAQLSFYLILGLFPFLLFLFATLGYFAGGESEFQTNLLGYLSKLTPPKATPLIADIVAEIANAKSGGKISFGLAAALWAASSGMDAIITTLNAAYDIGEGRPWWKRRLVAIALTIALAVFIFSAFLLLLYGGQIGLLVAQWFDLGEAFRQVWNILQWFVVLGFVLIAFGLLYRFAPNLNDFEWRWLLPGSVLAVVLWLLISLGFSTYVRFLGTFSATYGSLGGVIVLLFWLFLTGIAILIGGEMNAVIENAAAEAGMEGAKRQGQKDSGHSTKGDR